MTDPAQHLFEQAQPVLAMLKPLLDPLLARLAHDPTDCLRYEVRRILKYRRAHLLRTSPGTRATARAHGLADQSATFEASERARLGFALAQLDHLDLPALRFVAGAFAVDDRAGDYADSASFAAWREPCPCEAAKAENGDLVGTIEVKPANQSPAVDRSALGAGRRFHRLRIFLRMSIDDAAKAFQVMPDRIVQFETSNGFAPWAAVLAAIPADATSPAQRVSWIGRIANLEPHDLAYRMGVERQTLAAVALGQLPATHEMVDDAAMVTSSSIVIPSEFHDLEYERRIHNEQRSPDPAAPVGS